MLGNSSLPALLLFLVVMKCNTWINVEKTCSVVEVVGGGVDVRSTPNTTDLGYTIHVIVVLDKAMF